MKIQKNLADSIFAVLNESAKEDELVTESDYEELKAKVEAYEAGNKDELEESEYDELKAKCEEFEKDKLEENEIDKDAIDGDANPESVEKVIPESKKKKKLKEEEDEELKESDDEDELEEEDKEKLEESEEDEDKLDEEEDEELKESDDEDELEEEDEEKLEENEIDADATAGDKKPEEVDLKAVPQNDAQKNELKGKEFDDNTEIVESIFSKKKIEAVSAKLAESQKKKKTKNIAESLDKMLGKHLSKELRNELKTVFNAAVQEKVEFKERVYKKLCSEGLNKISKKITNSLVEKLDQYTDYAARKYISENKLAVEAGIRTKLTENFIDKLKTVFVESYITIPESKVDVVVETVKKYNDTKTALDEQINQNILLRKKLVASKKEEIFGKLTEDLYKNDAEKLKTLSESIEYKNAEQFEKDLKIVKSNLFSEQKKPSSKTALNEQVVDAKTGKVGIAVDEDENTEETDDDVKAVAEHLSKFTGLNTRF